VRFGRPEHLADPRLLRICRVARPRCTLTDLALASYEQALEPKKLVLITRRALRPLYVSVPDFVPRSDRLVYRQHLYR